MSEDATATPPRHPLYLDVPMMTSFLAYLEGGVADSLERVSTSKADTSSQREGGAGAKIPSILSFVGLDLSGRMASTAASGMVDEFKIARQHTSASLFNLLYDNLHAQSMVKKFEGGPEGLSQLTIGDLIEVQGRYVGNPLEDLLALLSQMLPYFAPDETGASHSDERRTSSAGRSGNPAKRAQSRPATAEELAAQELARQQQEAEENSALGFRLMQQMYLDVQASTVSDVVLRTESSVRIVATVAREFLTEQVSALLRSSNATILGKVTALLSESDSVNLTRRTVLGAMNGEQARDLLNGATGPEGFAWNSEDPIVFGPTAQVMPLAIYI
jgi:hypothetical protein